MQGLLLHRSPPLGVGRWAKSVVAGVASNARRGKQPGPGYPHRIAVSLLDHGGEPGGDGYAAGGAGPRSD